MMNKSTILYWAAALSLGIASMWSCTKDQAARPDGGYPDKIADIMLTKCATAGCHNIKSYQNANGLLLETYSSLFKGGNSGAVVVPYSVQNSSLFSFCNSYPDMGLVSLPTMPLNQPVLTREEVQTLKDWIENGAPDKNGNIPFADNAATRRKVYITAQGCDQVAVVDAASQLVMRWVPVGTEPGIESPHCLRVSPDGKYWYVSFTGGQYLQRFDAATDKQVDQLLLGVGNWNIFKIAPDGKTAMISDQSSTDSNGRKGKIKLINLEQMTEISTYDDFVEPHGIANNADCTVWYVTKQTGRSVYRIDLKQFLLQEIQLGPAGSISGDLYPHEIIMSPDYSKYFVTCQKSNELRVMDASKDTLIKIIPMGEFPQEFAMSHKKPYLYVSCMEDKDTESGFRGSVYVINYETMELVKKVSGPFFQPHALVADDVSNLLYVISRNVDSQGPAPHHTGVCGDRNGYFNVVDINTLELRNRKRYELSADTYSGDVRNP